MNAWRLAEPRPVNKSAGARPLVDGSGSVVALVLLGGERNEKNARLLESAPRLHLACVEVLSYLEEAGFGDEEAACTLRRVLGSV
jgi:hypothetical protein